MQNNLFICLLTANMFRFTLAIKQEIVAYIWKHSCFRLLYITFWFDLFLMHTHCVRPTLLIILFDYIPYAILHVCVYIQIYILCRISLGPFTDPYAIIKHTDSCRVQITLQIFVTDWQQLHTVDMRCLLHVKRTVENIFTSRFLYKHSIVSF